MTRHRVDLARGERIAEPRAPRSTVEDQDGLGRAGKVPECLVHCVHGAANDRFWHLLAHIDVAFASMLVAQTRPPPGIRPRTYRGRTSPRSLRLCKRMRHRDLFEIVVTQRDVARPIFSR